MDDGLTGRKIDGWIGRWIDFSIDRSMKDLSIQHLSIDLSSIYQYVLLFYRGMDR